MIKIFRFLRIAWTLAKGGGAWAGDCEWGVQDAMSLHLFLAGDTGQRLKARLTNASIQMNATAVQSPEPWASGRAAEHNGNRDIT